MSLRGDVFPWFTFEYILKLGQMIASLLPHDVRP